MANASKTHMGPATQGKGSGTGAMTDLPDAVLEENMVLSNRDNSRHRGELGLEGKAVQTEQFQDHAANHLRENECTGSGATRTAEANSSEGGDHTRCYTNVKS